MTTLTLNDRELGQFAAIARQMLTRHASQYDVLRSTFPSITDAAVETMIAGIEADPTIGSRKEQIDVAVYFAALYSMTARRISAEIAALNTLESLRTLFMLLPSCGDYINALTLLSRGGLATELTAKSIHGQTNAAKRHAKTNEAKAWVQQVWRVDFDKYESKADFARIHVALVANKFGVKVKPDTIVDNWLTQK
jgi:hypothetical protein